MLQEEGKMDRMERKLDVLTVAVRQQHRTCSQLASNSIAATVHATTTELRSVTLGVGQLVGSVLPEETDVIEGRVVNQTEQSTSIDEGKKLPRKRQKTTQKQAEIKSFPM